MKLFLKELPLRGLTVPLLLVLGPLLAEISLLLCNSASSLFSRAGQAPRTGGRLAALLVGKVVLVDLDRRPSFLVTKTVLVATTSSRLAKLMVAHLVTKTVLVATTSSRLASRWWVALCRLPHARTLTLRLPIL